MFIYLSFSVVVTTITRDTRGHSSDYRYRQYLYINIFMGNWLKQTKKMEKWKNADYQIQ